jgi:HSP20 family protein
MEQLLQDLLRWPALPPPRLSADIYESLDGDTYVVEVPVPGLEPSEIAIDATADGLIVSTRPSRDDSQDTRRYVQLEQQGGPMSRVIEFPVEVDPDRIRATLAHGMLKIEAPKAAAGPHRVIQLQKSA